MSQLLKKMLDKYIETNKETRLQIFIQSCNPGLKLTAKKVDLLKELVEEYKSDPVVFDDILAFCGYTGEKSSDAPKFNNIAEYTAYVDKQNIEKYKKGEKYDILDEVVKTHMGDVKDPNSIAYKVCNGQLFEFRFPQSAYKPDMVVRRLLKKNFVESHYDWYSFWNEIEQHWICTTNAGYKLKTSKHMDEKSTGG